MTHPHLAHTVALCFEGGGIPAGLAYPYILRRIDELMPPPGLARIRVAAGTSAGALTALAVALRYSPAAILERMRSTDWRRFADGGSLIHALTDRGGVRPLTGARWWLEDMIDSSPGPVAIHPAEMTFRDLLRVTSCRLIAVAWDESRAKQRPVVFSPHTTPDLPVVDAVLASMAIPVYFQPVRMALEPGGPRRQFIDGGLGDNYPWSTLVGAPLHLLPEQLVGLQIETPADLADPDDYVPVPRSFRKRFENLVGALVDRANPRLPEAIYARTVRVVQDTVGAKDFDVGAAARIGLMKAAEIGWTAALNRWEGYGKTKQQEDIRAWGREQIST